MRLKYALLLAMVMAFSGTAHAQSSQKPLQIIVPFAPGGSADGIARILSGELAAKLGRQVYVENKPGAGGSLGVVAPLGTPPAVIKKLSGAIAEIVARADIQERIRGLSVEPGYTDESSFGAYVAAESAKWKDIIGSLPKS